MYVVCNFVQTSNILRFFVVVIFVCFFFGLFVLLTADSRKAVVSFWRKNVHSIG